MSEAKRGDGVYDAIVIGAGFGGIHMLRELTRRGLSVMGIEGGSDVGGAWYWNTYPGARCDVESLLYSYSFCPELDAGWRWSERYPVQEEIQRYIGFAADLWDVRKHIRFDSWVRSADYDEAANRWTVTVEGGNSFACRYLVMAPGPLTKVVWPDIPGIDSFQGEKYHTARWPKGVGLAGKRIGVVGNGSSGTQFMTAAASEAAELHAFVRTPHFSVPAFNRPLTDADYAEWNDRKADIRADLRSGLISGSGDAFAPREVISVKQAGSAYSPEGQLERLETYWNFGGAQLMRVFADVAVEGPTNRLVGDFVRDKIRTIIKDPEKAGVMDPRHFPFGGKRLVVDTGFYDIFNRPSVHPHDLRATPIERITEDGIVIGGREIALDMLVFATGFDAAAGSYLAMEIRGRDGETLNERWHDGAGSLLGISVNGFPNFLMVNGPGAPGPFSNVVASNEWCVDAITAIIDRMERDHLATVEADATATATWMQMLGDIAAPTVFATTENWYSGTNVGGKAAGIVNCINPALFRQKLVAEQEAGFPNFHFARAEDSGKAPRDQRANA